MKPLISDQHAIDALVENPIVTPEDYPTRTEYLLEKYGSIEKAYEAWRVINDGDEAATFQLFILLLESHDSTKH